MQSPHRILLLLASMVGAALVGWIGAASMAPETRAGASSQIEDQQVETLMEQLEGNEVRNNAKRLLLLERLIALERLKEAEAILEPWLSAQSTPRELTLFKAELQRRNGQPDAARRSLKQLMRLHPDDPQILQLLVFLDQQQGRQAQAMAELNTRFQGLKPGQRLQIGLLLADLHRQRGAHSAAAHLYRQLADEAPTDARPLLALALLLQEQGRNDDLQASLKQARQRRDASGRINPLIDVMAGQLGLDSARQPPSPSDQPPAREIQAGSDRP
ncbi:hypothetical protein KR52_13660 [Synechococcus sp. KORDI-52]|uniref:tetratricopeptide repeat protein n=1 Tax=Synechococcus sp. KORDI-52 TaxID=585425 RepID=UPI0004E049B6|nr:tetratricopeptide repeat protein [Synechococcus sp. KORDI-52]AII50171.1 hypothetical protein KR52_13660 [Synechococcus sp. KORDI-52]